MISVVDFYVYNGADLHSQEEYLGKQKISPLIAATISGESEVVKYLLGEGADPNIIDVDSRTALIHSVLSSCNDPDCKFYLEITKTLIGDSQQKNLRDKYKKSVLDYVREAKFGPNHSELVKILSEWENKKEKANTLDREVELEKFLSQWKSGYGAGISSEDVYRMHGSSEEEIQSYKEEKVIKYIKRKEMDLAERIGENLVNDKSNKVYKTTFSESNLRYKVPEEVVKKFISLWNERLEINIISDGVTCSQKEPVIFLEFYRDESLRKFSIDKAGNVIETTKGFFYGSNGDPIEKKNYSCYKFNKTYLNDIVSSIQNLNVSNDVNIDKKIDVLIETSDVINYFRYIPEVNIVNHGDSEILVGSKHFVPNFILKPGENRVIKARQKFDRDFSWEIKLMNRFNQAETKVVKFSYLAK